MLLFIWLIYSQTTYEKKKILWILYFGKSHPLSPSSWIKLIRYYIISNDNNNLGQVRVWTGQTIKKKKINYTKCPIYFCVFFFLSTPVKVRALWAKKEIVFQIKMLIIEYNYNYEVSLGIAAYFKIINISKNIVKSSNLIHSYEWELSFLLCLLLCTWI